MIKPHLFLANAICVLLWCSLAIELAAQGLSQPVQQLTFQKADIPIEGEYIDAVFYADSLSQELRPKIIIRKESVDFMTREGLLKHRVVTPNGRFARIATNGRFIGFNHSGFEIYSDSGIFLWQDAEWEDIEGPGRLYTISSKGIVCNVNNDAGKVVFHDLHGTVTAEHAITDGMSRTLSGEWSPDGQYFLAYHGMRITQLHLFDARGAKLWNRSLEQKYVVEVEFSPQSKWIFLGYHDLSNRTSGNAILTTLNGSIVHDWSHVGLLPPFVHGWSHAALLSPFFSVDERYVLAQGTYQKERPGQQLVLFDIQTGAKQFEILWPKYIIDYSVFSDAGTIYILQDSEAIKLDMSGAMVGKIDFGHLGLSRDRLRIDDGSTADRVLIRSHQSFLVLNKGE
ncbi:hypothetical protein HUU39_16970 [candidate division KSB1 bacterium]|nr:hypothetical protein [candidate division KSB1 bacterium]